MTVHPKFLGEAANLPMADTGTHNSHARALVALTNDAALIRALQDLASAGMDVSVVSDLHSLTDELLQHTGATALIDAEAVEANIDGVVDSITRQLPELRLMIAGHGAEQQLLASRIASQAVFRFVHKPASPQRLKLFLDAAARAPEHLGAATAAPAPRVDAQTRTASASRGSLPRLPLAIGLAVIAAITVAAWMFWPEGKPPGNASADTTPAAASATRVHPEVAALLTQAEQAFAAARYVASDGSSAAELYRAALKLEPSNQAAGDGYDRAIDKAMQRAEESLLAGRLNDAGNIAAAVQLLAPDNSHLEFLNTQISRELERLNTDTSQRQAYEARQAQIRAALDGMKDRLQRGALTDPATSSAVSSFREAESIGANDAAVRSARETLVAALLTAADAELTAHRPPAARRLVDTARSINSNAPGLDVLRRRVDEAATQPAAPVPASPVARAETPAPAPVATPAAPAAESEDIPAGQPTDSEVVSARSLRLLRSQAPVYPQRALEKLISGWVELEFTVALDGSARNITVTGAEPVNTFERAAMDAMSRYRYAPVIRDGAAVEQRARLRMRFTAQDAK